MSRNTQSGPIHRDCLGGITFMYQRVAGTGWAFWFMGDTEYRRFGFENMKECVSAAQSACLEQKRQND